MPATKTAPAVAAYLYALNTFVLSAFTASELGQFELVSAHLTSSKLPMSEVAMNIVSAVRETPALNWSLLAKMMSARPRRAQEVQNLRNMCAAAGL